MSHIVRNNPYQEITRFDPVGTLEGMPLWPGLRHWLQELPNAPSIKLEITQDEGAYRVKAELPGVKKEDIEVKVEGNLVTLAAEVKRETEERKGETVVHSERYYGRQYRSFTLDREVDRAKATAKFDSGVLLLTLPKSGPASGSPLKIE